VTSRCNTNIHSPEDVDILTHLTSAPRFESILKKFSQHLLMMTLATSWRLQSERLKVSRYFYSNQTETGKVSWICSAP
jgi:hypothetical protein